MRPKAIQNWHDIAMSGDLGRLDALLAEDAVFRSPIVHTPQKGRAMAAIYLKSAVGLLNNGTFVYTNEWYGEKSGVLEFTSTFDGITINGVDIIAWNANDEITSFKVMVRPLKAINLLHQKIAEQLAALKG